MSFVEILIFTSLYFVLGGTIVFLTLVVVPSAVKTVRLAWINRNTENSSLEDEYNILCLTGALFVFPLPSGQLKM